MSIGKNLVQRNRRRRTDVAFTLLELLVVVGLIAILLGFIAPAYFKQRITAKITKAKNEVHSLDQAFNAYLLDFKVIPDAAALGLDLALFNSDPAYAVVDDLFKLMRGENSKQYPYYSVKQYAEAPSTDAAYDPFGITGNATSWIPYRVMFDGNYDNKVKWFGQTIYRPVIIWSAGPDHIDNTSDDIMSWN